MEVFTINEGTCTKCGACAAVCHLGIIDFQDGVYPKLFPVADKTCTKCGACVVVCPTDSLVHRDIPIEQCPTIDPSLKVSYEQCAQLIKSRRSIRTFRDKPVSRGDISRIIDAARYAATPVNLQNIRWIVFDNKELVDGFRKSGADFLLQAVKNSPGLAPLAELTEKRKDAGIDDFLHGAPVIVSTYARKDMPANYVACSMALAYFDLAANSLGLGCDLDGFFTDAANGFPPIKDTISLPEGFQI